METNTNQCIKAWADANWLFKLQEAIAKGERPTTQRRLVFVLWWKKSPSSRLPYKSFGLETTRGSKCFNEYSIKGRGCWIEKRRCLATVGIVRLEKVAQSLIKCSIFTSEASLCFTIPLIVKMDSSIIKVHVLLDSGASIRFMNKDFIDRHRLPLVTKKHPIPVEVIDGRPLVSWDVTHESTPLDVVIEKYHSIIAFNIIKSPSNQVVLGLLSSINIIQLSIGRSKDWPFTQVLLQYKNSVMENLLQFHVINNSSLIMEKYQRFKYQMLVVGARAFIRAAKKGTTFAIYATPITESVKRLEALPTRYKEYQDVFEKKNADLLSQHRLYDCAIDFQEGTQLPFGPNYNLSQNELVASENTFKLMKILPRILFDILSL
jgi:hypothetical protein